jgi:DNA-binding beta-propeller fold protein YncE
LSARVPGLQLRYLFVPSSSPIVVSPDGGNPVVIDLLVIVSNPVPTAIVTLAEIVINIPTGSTEPGALSGQPDPFAPVYDKSCGWTITASGANITLAPPTGKKTAQIAGSLLFTLPGIQINHAFGTVQLKVGEQSATGAWSTDGTTYTLVKDPNGYVITSFSAQPSALDDIDQPVTLHWTTTDDGEDLRYGVHADGWQPRDCLNKADCYQRSDGVTGVSGPNVSSTTTFTLDAIATETGGSRRIKATAQTTVRVITPGISPNSRLAASRSGRLLALHWLAWNAGWGQLMLDGETIDAAAPLDTYHAPYSLPVTGTDPRHLAQLLAFDPSGKVSTPFTFPEFRISDTSVPVGQYPVAVAATAGFALVVVADGVAVVDTAKGTVSPPITVGAGPAGIAISPGSAPVALVTNYDDGTVTVIDVNSGVARPGTIQVGWNPSAVAFTPDGLLALVGSFHDMNVTVIDILKMTAEATPIPVHVRPSSIAVAPDGATAFVADSERPLVTAIHISARTADPTPITLQGPAGALAVTPDGAALLATDAAANAVTVVDLPARTVHAAAIRVGNKPSAIALTPDGRFGLVTNAGDGNVSAIQVAARSALPGTIAAGAEPSAVAIAPDGLAAVAVNYQAGTATLL